MFFTDSKFCWIHGIGRIEYNKNRIVCRKRRLIRAKWGTPWPYFAPAGNKNLYLPSKLAVDITGFVTLKKKEHRSSRWLTAVQYGPTVLNRISCHHRSAEESRDRSNNYLLILVDNQLIFPSVSNGSPLSSHMASGQLHDDSSPQSGSLLDCYSLHAVPKILQPSLREGVAGLFLHPVPWCCTSDRGWATGDWFLL